MPSTLREIFESCSWKIKVDGQLPENKDEILYIWREEEASVAVLFFGKSASGILSEEHPSVIRSLYLGQDEYGNVCLCVRQVEREDYDPKAVAKTMADMMDATKVIETFRRATGGKE